MEGNIQGESILEKNKIKRQLSAELRYTHNYNSKEHKEECCAQVETKENALLHSNEGLARTPNYLYELLMSNPIQPFYLVTPFVLYAFIMSAFVCHISQLLISSQLSYPLIRYQPKNVIIYVRKTTLIYIFVVLEHRK